ncbi:hypothetical protein PN36_24895 [Candidatus Thiomargarita nelsonii]|uniref:Uncharacterized protein n=1 Tax=Candidatus Thiomargarita nelsonii TaxID=1003181 RepID=A0A0A6RVW4_9GAMM|nr:hypothetical protein PN36_24895 [Candidatus Thiomargarita nelsonii]
MVDVPIKKAVPIIRAHFTFTPNEITKAYQNGSRYAFIAISVGLDTPDQKYSNVTREFAKQKGLTGTALSDFRKQAIESLRAFSKNTDNLFEIKKALSEEDLAALIGHRDTLTLTEIVLEQMQRIAPVDKTLAAFLRYDDLLGNAVLFFFREQLRQDDRLEKTQTALQQEGLCLDVQPIGSQVKPTLIGLALLGLGFILPFALEFISRNFFQIRHGVTLDSVIVMACLLYILPVGQYLWLHRQSMPHLAMTFGLIGVGWAIWWIPVVIFDSLNISFLGKYGPGNSGGIIGLLLSILLVAQYLWRHWQTISRSAALTGLIGIVIFILMISVLLVI